MKGRENTRIRCHRNGAKRRSLGFRPLLKLPIVALLVTFINSTVTAQSILSSVREYDIKREQASSVVRQGNLDVALYEEPSSREIGFCHLPSLIPYTLVENGVRQPRKGTFESTASILLAIQQ